MNDKRPGMQQLVDRLLDGSEQRLSAAELDAVLSWLSGSDRHDGDALADILGHAPDHPRRRIAIFDQLDFQLFQNDRLVLAGAHLETGICDDVRRARYRRLMKAYHPDSYPEHAEWLTPRSQAIHQSYARFRKGRPPEVGGPSRPKEGTAKRPAKGPAQKHWPAARRSARLTPNAGPGPMSRLRTWLLGIDNLQQRILIGLVVICLVPVLYAYLAYKPYRAIQSPDSVVEAPPPVEQTQTMTREPDQARAEIAAVEHDEAPEPSRSMPEAVAPARPDRERSRSDAFDRHRDPIAPSWQRNALEDEAAKSAEPAPEASWLELAAWAESLSDTASATLARTSNPLAAAANDPSPAATPDRATAQPSPPAERSGRPSAPAGQAPAGEEASSPQASDARKVADLSEPDARDRSQPPPESASRDDAIASPSPARQPEQPAREASPRVARIESPGTDNETDNGTETETDTEPERARPQPRRARAEPSVATSDALPAPSETAPVEVTPAREQASESATPAAQADALDEHTRRHIADLLAGYRTSFENGWLEDFLDHFTADPRENKHNGRRWFRSNYGWLFDNSERRRLKLEIMDITRTDSHWTAVAQFDLEIDYDDRPNVHSSRQVRYRIETNEHDQLRIAAIEY